MRRGAAATIATLLVGAALAAAPSPAAAATAGGIVFECTALMGSWPGSGSGTCNGDAEVSMSGTDSEGDAFLVEGTGKFYSDFDYNARCVLNGFPPLQWVAAGVITIENVNAFAGGQLGPADLDLEFVTNVTGGFMVITVAQGTLHLPGGRTVSFQARGTGTFAPVLTAANTCPRGGVVAAFVEGQIGGF